MKKDFRKKGVNYKQIEATDKYFVYECTPSEGPVYYEVFKKVIDKINTDKKRLMYPGYDAYTVYPSDSQFGIWAWCCSTLNRVEKYRQRIINA